MLKMKTNRINLLPLEHGSDQKGMIMESSLNSMGLLVRKWLFCIQHLPCLEVVWRFEQTHFGMPTGAKMILALNEPK